MDIFTKNFVNYTHQANFKNANYCLSAQAPAPILILTPTLAATREPIDFNKISDIKRKRRFNNKLCLTYSLLSH